MNKHKNNKTTNYPIGDFLIRVKNIAMAGNKSLSVPGTKVIYEMAKTLQRMGYLSEVTKKDNDLLVTLAYKRKKPVLMDLKLVSRPGLRRYVNVSELESFRGPENYVLSTPNGMMSSADAIKKRIGGELIVKIW